MTPEFVQANPALIPRICDSIALVDLDLHADRLPEELQSSWARSLGESRAGRRGLARLLRAHFELHVHEFPSHQELNQQLALVNSPALCRGLDLTVKVLLWPRVVRRISRDSHLEAQRVLGADDCAFVAKTGPLLIRENQVPPVAEVIQGAEPSFERVFQDTRTFAVCQLWSGESSAFRTRVELKLPTDISIGSDVTSEQSLRQRIARLMRRILVQHVDPEVQQCFA